MRIPFSPPNQLTLLRIVLTPVFLAFLFAGDSLLKQLSLVVFILALLTDWYDGWVARRWGYVSRWGQFLDPLADKIVTSAALLAFVHLDLAPAWPIWLIVVRDIAITWLRSFAEFKGKPFETAKLAKTKTFLQFTIIFYMLLLYVGNQTESIALAYGGIIDQLLDYTLVYWLTVLIAALTIWTGMIYIIGNWNTIRQLHDVSDRVTESK